MTDRILATSDLALRWEKVCVDLLERTERFPRTARYSVANRIDNLALDVLESLTSARFLKGSARMTSLRATNMSLERLRVLLRLAHLRGYLSVAQWVFVIEGIDHCGRMLGGWLRKETDSPRALTNNEGLPGDELS